MSAITALKPYGAPGKAYAIPNKTEQTVTRRGTITLRVAKVGGSTIQVQAVGGSHVRAES